MKTVKQLALTIPLLISGYCNAQDDTSVKVIDPNRPDTQVGIAAIDTEKFELGTYAGTLSVEDFNPNLVSGVSLIYHANKRLIGQVLYGTSTFDKAAFENVSDLPGDFFKSYTLTYFELLAGYKVFDGRSYFGKKRKFNSALYLLGGIGDINFNDEGNTSFVIATSYRTVLTDWLTLSVDFRDHIFNRTMESVLNESQTSHNLEFSIGLNALF